MADMTAGDWALMGQNNAWQNNPFLYLVFIMLMRYWGNGYGDAAVSGALTRSELNDGLNFQTTDRNLTDIRDAVGNVGGMVQSAAANLSDKLCCGFSGVNSSIAQASFVQQQGTCEVNRNIDSIRYQMANDTCKITSAIHDEGELTRKAMVEQEIQNLRDSRESVQRELQSAQLTLANVNQTSNILNAMGRYVPYNGCGNSCCGNW